MLSNKELFLNWIKDKDLPANELDHEVAKSQNLKFNNHAENADTKEFVFEDKLVSSFDLVLKAS